MFGISTSVLCSLKGLILTFDVTFWVIPGRVIDLAPDGTVWSTLKWASILGVAGSH